MRNCKKCGKAGYSPEVVPLLTVGGYLTELCPSCRNAFHEYMDPQMLQVAMIESRHEAAIAGGMCSEAEDLARKKHAERTRLYAMSKAWVTGQ